MQIKTFGETIRELRVAKDLLLREVAAILQIDPSLLSRIETGEKSATREQVIQLAKILKADENELLVSYLSDRIVYELIDEELALEAMVSAEQKIAYLKKEKKRGRKDSAGGARNKKQE
jgi:transcriptional regulator with XRE-family HTH domain